MDGAGRASNAESVAGEMGAFASVDDGTLFLGADDAGTPLGMPQYRLDAVERWLLSVATENRDPPIEPLQPRWAAQRGRPEFRLFGDELRLALSAGAAKA